MKKLFFLIGFILLHNNSSAQAILNSRTMNAGKSYTTKPALK